VTDTFNLKAARVNRGLSRKSAAKEIGVAEGTLRTLEEGGTAHPGSAKKVADFFQVQVTDLMPLERVA
jgi:DNA-binding XRE family transcriptional regulator